MNYSDEKLVSRPSKRHVRRLYLDVAGKKKVLSQASRFPTSPGSTECMVVLPTVLFGRGP
jgi:hypothetical protein